MSTESIRYGSFVLITALTAPAAVASDCNANGIPDDADIQNGTSSDCDGNGVPDDCDLDGDLLLLADHDGFPLPPGVTVSMNDLWHVGPACRPAGECGALDFAYFGLDAQCNFDTGLTPAGKYEPRGIQLPSDSAIQLELCSY